MWNFAYACRRCDCFSNASRAPNRREICPLPADLRDRDAAKRTLALRMIGPALIAYIPTPLDRKQKAAGSFTCG